MGAIRFFTSMTSAVLLCFSPVCMRHRSVCWRWSTPPPYCRAEWSESRCSGSNFLTTMAAGPSAQMAQGTSLFLYERGQDKVFRSIQHHLHNTPYFAANYSDQTFWNSSKCCRFTGFRFMLLIPFALCLPQSVPLLTDIIVLNTCNYPSLGVGRFSQYYHVNKAQMLTQWNKNHHW